MNEAGPVIRASFPETEEHLLEAWERDPRRGIRSWTSIPSVIVAATLLVCVPMGIYEFANGDSRWWIAIPIGIVTIAVMLHQHNPAGRRRQMKKIFKDLVTDPPTEKRFEFRSDGFVSSAGNGSTTFHPWPTVPLAVQWADGLVIFCDRGICFWLPERVFAQPQDYLALVELIGQKAGNFHRV